MDSKPSAPPDSLYPEIFNADDFRMSEIVKIDKELHGEMEHYRLVQKRYKKVRKAAHYASVGLGFVSIALSSGAVASSFTGVGIVVGAPVAGVAAFSGLASTAFVVACKSLERKVNKHSRILALATAKHDSINSLVSRALSSNHVSDVEFNLIMEEMTKYRKLKETLRSKYAGSSFNLDKMHEEIWQEFTKKISFPFNR